MSRIGDEFSNRYLSEPLTWGDYMQSLQYGGAEQFDESLWNDREVVWLTDSLFAVPIYRKDILENPGVSHIELPNRLIVLSWDDFGFDAVLLRDVDDDTVISWLLVEEGEDGSFRVIFDNGNVFASLEDIMNLLKKRRRL
jgi:hypothetical protein